MSARTVEVSGPVDGGTCTLRCQITVSAENADRQLAWVTDSMRRQLDELAEIRRGPTTCSECRRSYPEPHHADCRVRRRLGAPVGFENALRPTEAGLDIPWYELPWVDVDGRSLPQVT